GADHCQRIVLGLLLLCFLHQGLHDGRVSFALPHVCPAAARQGVCIRVVLEREICSDDTKTFGAQLKDNQGLCFASSVPTAGEDGVERRSAGVQQTAVKAVVVARQQHDRCS